MLPGEVLPRVLLEQKVYVRIPKLTMCKCSKLFLLPFRPQLKSFWRSIAILSVASHTTHLDTKYLIVKTRTGNLTLRPLIFSFFFSTFKFACHGNKNAYITHTMFNWSCFAGVFLTSFFCVVPESPYSSDAASSCLLVAAYW